ncbi:MAG: hypothetical protein HZA04_02345 [Nitrospinae bacterium]|nr:hypothetical protein [Nitrospinota bacterium]
MIQVPAAGQAVCQPEFPRWPALARSQRAIKYPFDTLRDAWRRELIDVARDFTAQLGLPVPEIPEGAPLLLSGHQPYFYHPGVLFKCRLLARAAQEGMAAININVDTDVCEGFPAKLPTYEDRRHHTKILRVAPRALKRFYVDVAADPEALAAFAEVADASVRDLPERMFDHGPVFLRDSLAAGLPENLAHAMVVIRRRYAGGWTGEVLEAPLSELCRTQGYFDFAFGLLARADEFARMFNGALERYRAEHKLRYPANPFPNLGIFATGVETLFWAVKGETRKTLSVRVEDGAVWLVEDGIAARDGAALRDYCESGGLRLWPKAVALSLMHRLYLSDLFIHGIGGAKYDRITDEVIREFFGIEPPPFVTASATLAHEGLADPSASLMELKQTRREADFHPERYFENPPEGLVQEKLGLLERIRIPGVDKKSLGKELARVNGELNALLAPFKAELDEKIQHAEREMERFQALGDRELAYFLFPPDALPK